MTLHRKIYEDFNGPMKNHIKKCNSNTTSKDAAKIIK